MRTPVALLPLSLWTLVSARLHLIPEDPHAFPKYHVLFLNGLPLLNETAQNWLQNGLHGGKLEFLDQPWQEDEQWRTPPLKSIDGGSADEQVNADGHPDPSSRYKLELMKMGPRASFLCLIPPPPPESTPVPAEEPTTDVTPVHSWSLLQPLSESCLYHRQGWFTYAYCHNSHVRQFHELQKPNQQRLGEYKPEEDTEWEAYTLGRAPPTPEPGADLTVAQEAAVAANIELARNAGSRYLVQRWGDGTFCEKIGRRREIEVQFHCSMTMTDTILFVKETQTCHYVLHIATPRLCGEPGFRSRTDAHEETYIRCREVVSPLEYEAIDRDLPEREYPIKIKKQRDAGIAPPPLGGGGGGGGGGEGENEKTEAAKQNELLKRALEKLMASGDGEGFLEGSGEFLFKDEDGEGLVAFVEVPVEFGGDEVSEGGSASLEEVLRAAGYDVKPKTTAGAAGAAGADEEEKGEERRQGRDEL
ncbi:hypothetical protein BC835DRAFT_1261216 [Cytidiella melzeri]|nr:hypothetical protein BC835DRAFT_1261216 [Cytidiella melzeri]